MTLVMYDSIDPSQFEGLSMDAAAGYVDGAWPTYSVLARYVPAGTTLMSITVFGNAADCVDQESGNIAVGPAANWVRKRLAQGHWRPVVYTSASNMQTMINALAGVGVAVKDVRLWSAHYTYTPHICAPSVCGYPKVDGTQWTHKAHGRNLDQSQLKQDFFGTAPATPTPVVMEDDEDMAFLPDVPNSPLCLKNEHRRIRFFCNTAEVTIEVTFIGGPANKSVRTSYDLGPQGVDIPSGVNALVLRRGSEPSGGYPLVAYALQT